MLCSADILFYKRYTVSPIVSKLGYIIQTKNSRPFTFNFGRYIECVPKIEYLFDKKSKICVKIPIAAEVQTTFFRLPVT